MMSQARSRRSFRTCPEMDSPSDRDAGTAPDDVPFGVTRDR